MNEYVDGFVIPIRKENLDAYGTLAEKAREVWLDHGALDYRECVGDDMETKDMVAFPKLAGCGPGETVIFAWITYRSREHRDEVNGKVMKDPRITCTGEMDMPFECQRMAYGGFRTLVH
jgi:uncharacterized protein YbaA (DUF1428 family)